MVIAALTPPMPSGSAHENRPRGVNYVARQQRAAARAVALACGASDIHAAIGLGGGGGVQTNSGAWADPGSGRRLASPTRGSVRASGSAVGPQVFAPCSHGPAHLYAPISFESGK